MSLLAIELAVVWLVVLVSGVLVAAWQWGRLGVVAIALFAVTLTFWVLEFAAVATGYRGADDLVACAQDCSTVHYAAAVSFLSPPLLIALSAIGMLVAMGGRFRLRRARARREVTS